MTKNGVTIFCNRGTEEIHDSVDCKGKEKEQEQESVATGSKTDNEEISGTVDWNWIREKEKELKQREEELIMRERKVNSVKKVMKRRRRCTCTGRAQIGSTVYKEN